MQQTTLAISGMTCHHCVASVTRALRAVPGVSTATVTLESSRAVVAGTAHLEALIRAISEQGYEATLAP